MVVNLQHEVMQRTEQLERQEQQIRGKRDKSVEKVGEHALASNNSTRRWSTGMYGTTVVAAPWDWTAPE